MKIDISEALLFLSFGLMHKTTQEWKFGDSLEHDEHERSGMGKEVLDNKQSKMSFTKALLKKALL